MDVESPEVGILKHFDYCVGKNGWQAGYRQEILEKVFRESLEDKDFDANYLEEWGEPESAQRLEKMVRSISAFVANAESKDNPPAEAIDDWLDDLAWLKETFYDGNFDFPWPLDLGS